VCCSMCGTFQRQLQRHGEADRGHSLRGDSNQKLCLPDGVSGELLFTELEATAQFPARAIHPAKRHGRGCQQHKFALPAAKPRAGWGPAETVLSSAQRTASLLPSDQRSRAAVLTEERKKMV